MKKQTLVANTRTECGTNASKRLRQSGFVPAVIYAQSQDTENVQLDLKEMENYLIYHGVGATLTLEVGNETKDVLIKDIQKTVLKNNLLHVDFQELIKGQKVNVNVHLRLVGKESIDKELVIVENLHEVEMSVLPKDLIETIDVNIEGMAVGESIKVSDLKEFNDSRYEMYTDPEKIIVSFSYGDAEIVEDLEEEVQEPALIGEETEEVEEV